MSADGDFVRQVQYEIERLHAIVNDNELCDDVIFDGLPERIHALADLIDAEDGIRIAYLYGSEGRQSFEKANDARERFLPEHEFWFCNFCKAVVAAGDKTWVNPAWCPGHPEKEV